MRRFSITKVMQLILAPALSLWVAGAGCLLGCQNMTAMAAGPGEHEQTTPANIHTLEASGDVCASGMETGGHGCCKNKSRSTAAVPASTNAETALPGFTSGNSGMVNACPLAISRATVVAKTHDTNPSSSVTPIRPFLSTLNSSELTAPFTAPLRLPNRGHTYLRCCTFLI